MNSLITIEEMKQIELHILKYVRDICLNNDLCYFMEAGTLLGAVRHKGFIPWDDDIDIAMPRKDFEKLLKILRNNSEYRLIDPYDINCFYPFAKLCDKRTTLYEYNYPYIEGMGVYIDIFPFDNFPPPGLERIQFYQKITKAWSKISKSYPDIRYLNSKNPKKLLKFIGKYIYSHFNDKVRIKQELFDVLTQYNTVETEYMGFGLSQYKENALHKKNNFSEITLLAFEDDVFAAPIAWKEYLTEMYGDYLQFPPIEKRKPHHEFEAYWINNSYEDYKL
ncbi:phosphorylcholine transferase LicD [Enterocloster aldenensis]|uniref:LicD family protein n=1 Tax=Enterocloster aldenensis TaxID=358742 RepID=UPI0040265D8A